MVSTSAFISARMQAVSMGWTTYASPLLRVWPMCASTAKDTASSTLFLAALPSLPLPRLR